MAAPEPATTQILGDRYTVIAPMSVGLAVTTYRATCPPNRPVVVKVFSRALDAAGTAALRRAAASTTELPRGSALEVLEVGVDAALGATFVATELSAWPSLSHLVELCPLSGPDAAVLAASLARALGPAHARGLAHLGLKPNNVFVGPAPAYEVRLGDFCATVARAAVGPVAQDAAIAPWLAPEQASEVAAGPSADVYSAALVVFFALTGHPLVDGAGDEVLALRDLRGRAERLGVPLSAAWDAPFAQALNVDPARRFRSVAQLADAFARASRDEAPQEPSEVAEPAVPPPRPTVPSVSSATGAAEEATAARAGGGGRRALVVASWVTAVVAVALVVVIRVRRRAPQPAPVTTPAAAVVVPSSSAVRAPPVVAPSAPASAPELVAPPTAASSAPAPRRVDRDHALLVVKCTPACDSIWVDGHPAAHAAEGVLLPAGVHMIGANLAHHPSTVKPVVLRRGEVHPFDVDFSQ